MKNLMLAILLMLSLGGMAQKKTNVLFIAIDDLKPMLGCYGDEFIKTPAIDKLAANGVVFTNAHCQQAVCGPSRASIMTGMRPDYTGVWDLKTRMRDVNPDILAMPEYFKGQGYTTVAVGKIYDPRCVDKQYDKPSWSIPYKESAKYSYPEKYGEPGLSYFALEENKKQVEKYTKEAHAKGENNVHGYVSKRFKPSVECADVEDDAYMDTQIANNAIKYMNQLAKEDEPFFLAVGFKRPHLPFAAPKKYWDLYDREDISLAEYREAVKNGVDFAYHKSNELQSYTDIPALASFSDIFTDNLPEWKQKELIHGYQACVSYIDAQIERLMQELKKNGLDKNTVIVLWGDHGWHLGDHSMWCKHSNFEQATRVPLIFSVPNGATGYNANPVEFIDVFPTLCEASGIEIPEILQGESLMPVMKDVDAKVKDYAVSQFGRGKLEGYSIRTDRYRLTLWIKDDYRTFSPFDAKDIEAGELYDYKTDPLETENYYNAKKYKSVKKQLMTYFKAFIETQNKELVGSGSMMGKKSAKETILKQKNNLAFIDLATNWNVIARNGADADFSVEDGKLKVEVRKLGAKPWDLTLALKETIALKQGQTATFTFAGKGKSIKFSMGPLDGERTARIAKLSSAEKVHKVKVPVSVSGDWPIKIQFMEVGTYEIGEIVVAQ
ncbi:sulfatase [Labilibacter sediminis]|nr:sulfatase [Labilibacter sediminis]